MEIKYNTDKSYSFSIYDNDNFLCGLDVGTLNSPYLEAIQNDEDLINEEFFQILISQDNDFYEPFSSFLDGSELFLYVDYLSKTNKVVITRENDSILLMFNSNYNTNKTRVSISTDDQLYFKYEELVNNLSNKFDLGNKPLKKN